MTALKQLREAAGLTRREVSEQSGINLRSLQDYEQGHKNIVRANGEILFKLSLVLGCTVEDLLTPYLVERSHSADLFFQKDTGQQELKDGCAEITEGREDSLAEKTETRGDSFTKKTEAGVFRENEAEKDQEQERDGMLRKLLGNSSFRSAQYHLSGRWLMTDKGMSIIFVCRGSVVQLPLPVWVTEKTLPWLSEAAVMRMERYMEDLSFQDRSDRLAETGEWDDWG